MPWSTGSRGFSAGNVASLDSGSITFSGSNKYARALAASGAGTPTSATSVVLDPAGVNQAFTALQAATTFNTNFEARPYGLVAPADVTAKVVRATWAGNQDETLLVVDFYTSIDQSTVRRTLPTPGTGTGNAPTLAVTSVSGDLVVGSVMFGTTNGDLSTITSSQVTIREKIESADIGPYELAAQGDTTAAGTSTTVGFNSTTGSGPQYAIFGESLIPFSGGGGGSSDLALSDDTWLFAPAADEYDLLIDDYANLEPVSMPDEDVVWMFQDAALTEPDFLLFLMESEPVATASGPITLGGNALVQVATAAALQLLVPLAGSSAAQGGAAGSLGNTVSLGGSASAQVQAAANVAKAVQFAAAAAAAAGATGSAQLVISIGGTANVVGNSSATLATLGSVDLAGSGAGRVSAAAALALQVGLAGAVLGVGGAGGTLQANSSNALSGAAVVVGSSSGQLALSVALNGASLASAGAQGTLLSAAVTLSGQAAQAAGASGTLVLSVPLQGQAAELASAGGGLVLSVLLGGSGQAKADASARFSQPVLLSGGAGAIVTAQADITRFGFVAATDPAWTVRLPARRWVAQSRILGRRSAS